ncbi:MAG TPA: PKD domain-containing protein, partial [Flavobacteriales bacterium]|nr:PKD domain-containing protein [Flavobacteriales bacterium]
MTDIFGYTSSDTMHVYYRGNYLSGDSTICLGDTLQWATGLDTAYYGFLWSDGSTGSGLAITQGDSYSAIITDTLSCIYSTDTLTVTIDTFSLLVSLGNDTSFCSGNSITLQQGDSLVTQYLWLDNSTGSSLQINTTGTYWVTVTDSLGCSATDSIAVGITGTSPTALFSHDSVCFNDSTAFTDLSTPASVNSFDSIIGWEWVFGDGDSSFIQGPSHLYPTPGTYNVSLTITSDTGCAAVISDTVLVKANPTAEFDVGTACIDNPYQFYDSSQVSLPDSIIAWSWDFGDGVGTSVEQSPAYIYAGSGNMDVTLAVQSSNECVDTVIYQLTVVDSASNPTTFSLISPLDNSILTGTLENFWWNSSANSNSYSLQIASDSSFAVIDTLIEMINATSYEFDLSSLSLGESYWRVIAYNLCNDSITSTSRRFTVFDPAFIGGNQLWLAADIGVTQDISNNVSLWSDQSVNGNDAQQLTGSMQPVFVDSVIHTKPVLRFDGGDDVLEGGVIAGLDSSSFTLYIVSSGATQAVDDFANIFSINHFTDGFWFSRRAALSEQLIRVYNNYSFPSGALSTDSNSFPNSGYPPTIFTYTKDLDAVSVLYGNGTLTTTSTDPALNSAFVNSSYVIGDVGSVGISTAIQGDIAEIILYDSLLSDSSRVMVEQYLRYKYAPPVNLGPDISLDGFCDTALSAGERFVDYLWSTGETTDTITLDQPGTYWVSVTDIFGYTSSDTMHVYYRGNYLSGNMPICVGDTF